jgi:hypothetical protein
MNSEQKRLARQMFINRQPTLFRHGMNVVDVIPQECSTISVSNLLIEPMNADKISKSAYTRNSIK